jgi:hypothetical protein
MYYSHQQFKILGLIKDEREELQRLVRDSPLPLLVSHWIKNREDATYLDSAAVLLSTWDAANPSRNGSIPARSSSTGPPLPTIVVQKSSVEVPTQKPDARTDAAAALTADVTEAPKSPPRIPSALKGKGRLIEQDKVEKGTRRRQKTFQELDELEDSDVTPAPQKPAGPSTKPKASPVRRKKAAGNKRRPAMPTGERHDPACGNCERAEVECLKDQGGGACIRCMKQKHRCDYSRARRTRREKKNVGSEVDEVDEVSDINKSIIDIC